MNAGPGPGPAGRMPGQQGESRPRGPLLRECPPPYKRHSGQLAAVLLYRNGGHSVLWPERREDHRKPLIGGPYTVFEVLLGRNVTKFDLSLPASGDGVFFDVAVSVQWEVVDPFLVATQRVWDVAELLRDDLLDGLRAVSRRFGLTEAQGADEAVRDELRDGRLVLGRDLGLRTRVLVFFDLDKDVKTKVGEADRTLVEMGVDQRRAAAERRKDAYARELVAERARELEGLLRQGEITQIAHHMAANPDKQWQIRRELLQEKREGQADFLAVFNRLIDTGVLERHDIDDTMLQVLEHLRESTGGVLGGVADRVLPPARPRGPRRALEAADTHQASGARDRRDRPDSRDDREAQDVRGSRDHRDPRQDRNPGPHADSWDPPDPWETAADDAPRRREPIRPPWEDDPDPARDPGPARDPDRGQGSDDQVYEPTRVESASERSRDRNRPAGPARPSADFDDWDDE
ncbi:hypothetical protein [Streptomyces sp. NPDC006368]|uniref:hypothetical protein n=1 Tax=Streptomyces sp. NPDC006368 TaxID=3156760 RepID=UPI00339EAC9E